MSDDNTTSGPAVPAVPAYGAPQPYPGAPAQNAPVYPVSPPQPQAPYPAAQGLQQAYPAAPGYSAQPHPGAVQHYAPAQPYASAQPYAAGQPYAAPLPTSGLAVASLITGIAGIVLSFAVFPLLASIAAVITGHMALKQIRQNSAVGGRGMAIAGLILGYVGVGILALTIIVTVFSFIFIGTIGFLPFLVS